MESSFRQWESDPLFSAAEVVQDSADRMDSIFRMLLHEQSLLQGLPADQKLLNSIEYHRRDLETALGTTKWQLQDFEKAVSLSALSDRSHARADVISRHKQFIAAIREQIIYMEKSLEDPSIGDFDRNTPWISLNEQDRDGLALFLSGGNSLEHHIQHDEDSNIMRRYLYSPKCSALDGKCDEIVELQAEDIHESQLNNVQRNHSFENVKEANLRKASPYYSSHLEFEASVPIQESPSHGQGGNWDSEFSDPKAKSFVSKNNSRGSRRRLDILGFLGRLYFVYYRRMSRRFSKRMKDEDMKWDFDQRPLSSYADISQAEQGQHTWRGLDCGSSSSRRLCSNVLRKTIKSFQWAGGSMRGYMKFQLTLTIVFTLILLGVLFYLAA